MKKSEIIEMRALGDLRMSELMTKSPAENELLILRYRELFKMQFEHVDPIEGKPARIKLSGFKVGEGEPAMCPVCVDEPHGECSCSGAIIPLSEANVSKMGG